MMKSTKSFSTVNHWGELPVRELQKQEVITPDIIENVWAQVMEDSDNPDCNYQSSSQENYIT